VDARDIAAVAARALTQDGHESCSYVLTGPEAVTDRQIAAMIGEVTGASVPVVEVTDADVGQALRGAGLDDWTVEGLTGELNDLYRAGAMAMVSPDVEAVLGRPATPLRRFVEEHAGTFATG
jgi:uncharacterized protein YbjT (DUF2867 family)